MQPDPSKILDRLSITVPADRLLRCTRSGSLRAAGGPQRPSVRLRLLQVLEYGEDAPHHREKHGCGAGHLLGVDVRPRKEMVEFLCDEEGLRASHELMDLWLDSAKHYQPVHDHLLIGPLRPGQYQYLRTVTFYVNPDQLSVLSVGATYYSRPDDLPPVLARFGSGCMQLTTLFDDLEAPQALVGAMDHAMRIYLEPCVVAFTVTKPMFELLCRWADDPKSSLHAKFLDDLIRRRGGSLA